MRRSSVGRGFLWVFLASVLPLSASQAYDFGVDVSRLTRRAEGEAIIVGRLPAPSNGTLPLRPEIRHMRSDSYRWDLYILALSMFQYTDQVDPMSWYQVAGIHGVPFTSWNGVEPISGTNQSGYCTHSSVLFPMWHRPYLALYEQQMYKFVNAIADMFSNATQRQLYMRAASDFRIPYWDWSLSAPPGQTHLPDFLWSPVIVQYGPNGIQSIRNPLYSYEFHPLDQEALIWNPLKQWNETKRAPNTTINVTNPPSSNEVVNSALLSKLPELQQRLYIVFSNYHDFNSFSNKAWALSQKLSSLDSIEAIHDVIHIYGGSKGHMTYVPLSAFDPLFFLHHTMTDRLVAMWQVLNPSSWIVPMEAGETSFTAMKGTLQASDTPLTPFLASQDGTFWDSDMSRSTEAFGYNYADTVLPRGSTKDLRETLIQKINAWYGAASPVGLMAKELESTVIVSELDKDFPLDNGRHDSTPNVKLGIQKFSPAAVDGRGYYTEWIANTGVNVEALDGNFGVHFFFGEPPKQEWEWENAVNHVGTVSIFAMNRSTGSRSKISGAIPLTSALMKMVASKDIDGLSPATVMPFLQKSLKFAVLGSNNQRVDPNAVDGLHISITSTDVRVPHSEFDLPEWGNAVRRLEVWA